MPSFRTRCAAAALPAAASVLLAAGAAPAFATESPYTVKLRQELSVTATSWQGSKEPVCADIPTDKDGWHFVLPTNDAHFVKLTVTFKTGGEQVITSFGPPSDKHAFAASAAGDTLVSAVAEVKGGDLEKFNLSHTCPASVTPGEKPADKPGEKPADKPGEKPADKPSEESADKPSETPAATPSSSAAAPASSGNGDVDGDLAETGSSAPVGMLAAVAAALVAGGGYLLTRRRTARQH